MANNSDRYPLIPLQEGMLYNFLYYPESGIDILQAFYSFNEPLNKENFKEAWQKVIERHTVLRTKFEWERIETPMQIVMEQADMNIIFHDLQDLDSLSQESKIREYIKNDRKKSFDLREAPLMRIFVFILNPSEFSFLWTFHHSILDGRSAYTILEEFELFYDALKEGTPLVLPEPKPFREFAEWMHKQNFGYSESYWREALKAFDSATPIPFINQMEVSHKTDEVGISVSYIPREKKLILQSFANEIGITLNNIIQGAWALLLHHYTQRNDIMFGATRTCRHSGIEGEDAMIGLFINTVPVCVSIDRQQILTDFLRDIRKQNNTLRQYENTPVHTIHKWSNLPPNSALFETCTLFEKGSPGYRISLKGEKWSKRKFKFYQKTGYPINVAVDDDDELIIRIEYEKHLFDIKDIERMLNHIIKLILEMPSHGQTPAVKVPYLSENELNTLLIDFNRTYRNYNSNTTLVELFESQVAKTPEAVALEFEGSTLSYGELNRRSNQLAHYLRRMSVGPEVPVGVFMERSLEMVIAIYGIIKAGGAYVPLDPQYPLERLNFMIEDTKVPVVLTQDHLVKRIPSEKTKIICLDTEWKQFESETTSNPEGGARPENMAYIIYTSGSTGKPKGVINEHRGIVNRLLWMQEAYHLDRTDRVLQKTPFTFDVSVWEFFWPLQVGARLVITIPDGHKDSAYLVRLIKEKEITTLHFVPSMLQLFLEEDGLENCNSLKRVFCSGEALRSEHKQRFFERLNAELHNLYGPTEAAVDVTYWECKKDDGLKFVPIGFPVANTQIYILNPDLQPVPIGCSGELHIGGVQVARGYLNRPELTNEKFIPDPFSKLPGAKLYKTGDLARYMPDGSIEYIGRIDFQVKIRGQRVELGEIESRIDEYEGIAHNVVIVFENTPGNQILVTYYTGLPQNEVDVAKLRKYLLDCLPDYMVPQHYIKLDAIPLSPNGKADRKALPSPKFERRTDAIYIEPRNKEEKIVAEVWKELLILDKVGIDDSFFDLGGHSLLLIRMLGKLKPHFEKDLKIIDFFRYPSIRTLVEYLTNTKKDESASARVANMANRQKEFIKNQQKLASQRRN